MTSNNDRPGNTPPEIEELLREGSRLFRARSFQDAADVYLAAASQYEVPRADLCARLSTALAEIGKTAEACEWALRTMDADDDFAAWSSAARVLSRCGEDAIPRVRRRVRVAVVGTWTTSAFVPLLRLAAARLGIAAEMYEAPFGQYFNEALDPGSALHRAAPDAVIFSPDRHALAIPPFSGEPEAAAQAECDRWAQVWSAVRATAPRILVQHNFALPFDSGFGHFGSTLAGSRGRVGAEVNRRLAAAAGQADVGIVDVDALASGFGKSAWFDDRNWHFAKVASSAEGLPLLARHTAAVLAARLGVSRRCLVFDLDNTIWGGLIGEDGVSGLQLGEGAEGEAFVDFQKAIKELGQRGVVLAVCSKNDASLAREPFESHPEMVLRLEDVAVFVANWESKAQNLIAIAGQLNLGLDALAFVDDSPQERDEVRHALPEVDVIALPRDPAGYRRTLERYPFFEPASFTADDQFRARHYRAKAIADTLRTAAGSFAEYQASLAMTATVGAIDAANIARVVQLINKTNQFNLTTRRRDRASLEALLARPGVQHFWVRLSDRFNEHGVVAVAIACPSDGMLEIDTFLMSCRVIGRGLETVVRDELVRCARRTECATIVGTYVPTPRNAVVADLYQKLGFGELTRDEQGGTTWVLPVGDNRQTSSPIQVKRHEASGAPVSQ